MPSESFLNRSDCSFFGTVYMSSFWATSLLYDHHREEFTLGKQGCWDNFNLAVHGMNWPTDKGSYRREQRKGKRSFIAGVYTSDLSEMSSWGRTLWIGSHCHPHELCMSAQPTHHPCLAISWHSEWIAAKLLMGTYIFRYIHPFPYK